MTDDYTQEIRERLGRASDFHHIGYCYDENGQTETNLETESNALIATVYSRNDESFFSHAPTDISRLLEEREILREALRCYANDANYISRQGFLREIRRDSFGPEDNAFNPIGTTAMKALAWEPELDVIRIKPEMKITFGYEGETWEMTDKGFRSSMSTDNTPLDLDNLANRVSCDMKTKKVEIDLEDYDRLISELREKEKAIDQLIENFQSVRSDWVSELTKRTDQLERLQSAEESLKKWECLKCDAKYSPDCSGCLAEEIARAHFEKFK